MPIKPVCPECKASFKTLPDEYIGKKAKCPKCGHRFVIPASSQESGPIESPAKSDGIPAQGDGLATWEPIHRNQPPVPESSEPYSSPDERLNDGNAIASPVKMKKNAPRVNPQWMIPPRYYIHSVVVAALLVGIVLIFDPFSFFPPELGPPPDGFGPVKFGMSPSDFDHWPQPIDIDRRSGDYVEYVWQVGEIEGMSVETIICSFFRKRLAQIRIYFNDDGDIERYLRRFYDRYPREQMQATVNLAGNYPGNLWIWYEESALFGYITPTGDPVGPTLYSGDAAKPFLLLVRNKLNTANWLSDPERVHEMLIEN